jgi:hypothetical protein
MVARVTCFGNTGEILWWFSAIAPLRQDGIPYYFSCPRFADTIPIEDY